MKYLIISPARVYLFPCVNPYPANVEYRVSSYNARKWQMEFNLAFKGLIKAISKVCLSL